MLKILQPRLQQYLNHKLPDVQPGYRKDRRTRDQIASNCWIIEKETEYQKNIYYFIDYAKAFDCVQFSSVTHSCLTPCDPMECSTPGLPVHHQLPKFTQTQSITLVMPSNHLILFHPPLPLPSIFPSIMVFSNESVLLIRWQKYCSFSFNITPSNEYSGLISFRSNWFDLLAVQRGSQKSSPTPQSKSINSLVLSFLYSLTLTSIHDYWKKHSFD